MTVAHWMRIASDNDGTAHRSIASSDGVVIVSIHEMSI